MCLVSVCPKGTVKFSEKVEAFIRQGANSNRDGSGFMFKRNGTNIIEVRKGYFNIEDLISDLKALDLKEEDELAIHHRIGTSGLVSKENTHPFVCSDEHNEVCATNISIDKPALVHNGMFQIYKYMKLNPDFSDTYAFSRYIMGNKNIMNIYNEDRELFTDIFGSLIGYNKICILFPDKDLQMIGNFLEDEGYFHSNSGYKSYVYNRGGVETRNSRDWESDSCGISIRSKKERTVETETMTFPISKSDLGSLGIFDNVNDDNTIFHLNSGVIDINDDNYHHFCYIKKSNFNIRLINKDTVFFIKNFNKDAVYQTIHYHGDSKTVLNSMITEKIIDECYYLPIGTHNVKMYRDYYKLYTMCIKPTKNGIKALEKSLSNPKQEGNAQILYKKYNKYFMKDALKLHLKDLKDVYALHKAYENTEVFD